VAQLRNRG